MKIKDPRQGQITGRGHWRLYYRVIDENGKEQTLPNGHDAMVRKKYPKEWQIDICGYLLEAIEKAPRKAGIDLDGIIAALGEAKIWKSKNIANMLYFINGEGRHWVKTRRIGKKNIYFATYRFPEKARQTFKSLEFSKYDEWDGWGVPPLSKRNGYRREQRALKRQEKRLAKMKSGVYRQLKKHTLEDHHETHSTHRL